MQVDDEVDTWDNVEMRKRQGSYYTLQVIVRYLVDRALGHYLVGKTTAETRDLRVLDPSCGSGSFLIYAYVDLDPQSAEIATANLMMPALADQATVDYA